MAAAPSNAYIFSTLEKFSEGNGAELNSFLSKFDRCCVIGNKVDVDNNPVKGQLLMLFVAGRASAILEEFEHSISIFNFIFQNNCVPLVGHYIYVNLK